MKLQGYIRPFINNSFTIPIYHEGKKSFTHSLDDNFKISFFTEINFKKEDYKELPTITNFYEGAIGPIIFQTDKNIIYGKVTEIIPNILQYTTNLHLPKKRLEQELLALSKVLNIN